MDPDAALRTIEHLLGVIGKHGITPRRRTELENLCGDLFEWLERGGFQPNWSACPVAAGYFKLTTTSWDEA